MEFLLKKVLGGLLMPLPLGFLILVVALCLCWRGRRLIARILVVAVCGGWLLISLSPLANAILRPLEFAYPKYEGQAVDTVVVLGGYHASDARTPLSSLLSATSLNRLTEAVLILRQQPEAKLALSGYAGKDSMSNAAAMAKVAQALGVAASRIMLAEAPRDTAGEAAHWARTLKGQRVALVSSATHMRRAVFLFKQQGLRVIPAPTRYLSAGESSYSWQSWLPDGENIDKVEQAWHEYLGLWWAQLRS